MRLIKLWAVSSIGIRKIKRIEMAQIMLCDSKASFEDRHPSINPRKSAPQSPINIFAFGKLCGKNPMAAPKSNKEQSKTSAF